MTTKKISYLFTIFSAMFAGNVHAAPTGASGIIRSYYLSGGSNYSFRISLYQNGADQLSGCNSSFAYVNANDDNYQAKVSGLMLAYSSKLNVQLYLIAADSQGYCRIVDYMVSG